MAVELVGVTALTTEAADALLVVLTVTVVAVARLCSVATTAARLAFPTPSFTGFDDAAADVAAESVDVAAAALAALLPLDAEPPPELPADEELATVFGAAAVPVDDDSVDVVLEPEVAELGDDDLGPAAADFEALGAACPTDEDDDPVEFPVSAVAIWGEPTTSTPIPRAAARAPTRPMQRPTELACPGVRRDGDAVASPAETGANNGLRY